MSAYRDIQNRSGAVYCAEQSFTLAQVKHLLFVKYGLEKTADNEWSKNIKIMNGGMK